jgi:hypothetical protein
MSMGSQFSKTLKGFGKRCPSLATLFFFVYVLIKSLILLIFTPLSHIRNNQSAVFFRYTLTEP